MDACSSKLGRKAGLLARGYQAVKRKIQGSQCFALLNVVAPGISLNRRFWRMAAAQ